MKIEIRNAKTGKTVRIDRDVCSQHPAWVHTQCGTSGEIELQQMLDGANVEDWYRDDGSHKGDDECGISMYRTDEEGAA